MGLTALLALKALKALIALVALLGLVALVVLIAFIAPATITPPTRRASPSHGRRAARARRRLAGPAGGLRRAAGADHGPLALGRGSHRLRHAAGAHADRCH